MTYNEKKSLYESIMKDVAKTIKRKLNESLYSTSYFVIYDLDNDCICRIYTDLVSKKALDLLKYVFCILYSAFQGSERNIKFSFNSRFSIDIDNELKKCQLLPEFEEDVQLAKDTIVDCNTILYRGCVIEKDIIHTINSYLNYKEYNNLIKNDHKLGYFKNKFIEKIKHTHQNSILWYIFSNMIDKIGDNPSEEIILKIKEFIKDL